MSGVQSPSKRCRLTRSITPGMSLSLEGELKASRGKGQAIELVVKDCKVLGGCDPEVRDGALILYSC